MTTRRNVSIRLRARRNQRDLIDRAAKVVGRTSPDFVLEAAVERAQSVMLDRAFLRVNAKAFREFNKLLDAPDASNPGLDRLLKVKAPRYID